MPDRERRRLLILGGTGEAAALARDAVERFAGRLEITTSLAGRTAKPAPVPGRLRTGGFGGAEGLAEYLRANSVDMVVDATHPFAAVISANARDACARAGVPRIMLVRPPWRRARADRWIEVDDIGSAAAALAGNGARAFLTVGAKELHQFAGLAAVFFLVRLIEAPRAPLALENHAVVVGRGPFTVAGEKSLLAEHRIDVVVSKASGGAATRAKITAARALGLPVVMVRRPPLPEGERAMRLDAVLVWIGERVVI